MKIINVVLVIVVSLVFLGMIGSAFITLPVRMVKVRNDELVLRHYYDYRSGARVLTYFAELRGGEASGSLYAVELVGKKGLSRNPIIQFSPAGTYDFNPGTLIKTVPADSDEAITYQRSFAEVRTKFETQKWWERVLYPH